MERFDGESVPPANILDADGFVRVQRKHCTVRQLLNEGLIPADYASRFTTVTTVRNPYDSLVSLYIKKRESYQKELANPSSWVHRVRGYTDDMEFCRTHSFEEWLLRKYAVRPMDRLLGRGRRDLNGKYADGAAIVMRFERLQQDFEAMMRSLGVEDDVTIPTVNVTRQRGVRFQDYYTPRTRRLVGYVFRDELARYGYSMDGVVERSESARRIEVDAR